MDTVDFKCNTCGQEKTRIVFEDGKRCHESLCCNCCKRLGLQLIECEMAQLELKRFAEGKELNKNDIKGLLLEKALSDTLHSFGISHNHNPFDNTYPCYQNKRPDITIPKIDLVIECKNLSKKQVDHTISDEWLDKNVIKRQYSLKHKRKIVLFSFKPRRRSRNYLNVHGWKVYSLGEQVLTLRQENEAVGKLRRRFYWLKREFGKTQKPIPKQQTRLKLAPVPQSVHSSIP
jgi:hypothetical protein